ncbi:hypothetical protein [Roseofilum sp. Guam]|nr:hypothetical protein [Roseofilum sp. Guam]
MNELPITISYSLLSGQGAVFVGFFDGNGGQENQATLLLAI